MKVRQTLIGGSRKMIVYDDLEPSEKVKVYDRGVTLTRRPEKIARLRVGYRTGDMWAPQLSAKEALLTEIEHFVDCVDNGAKPITDGRLRPARRRDCSKAAMLSMRQRGTADRSLSQQGWHS